MPTTLPGAESALEAIERIAAAGLPAQQLIEEAAARIDRVVPSDGLFMAATDPDTTLCMGAGIVRGLPHEMCQPTWDYEFMVPDYLKFADVVHSGRAVADLHDATGGRPERSARWRELAGVSGFRAEIRAAFTVDGAAWGVGQFNRLGALRYSEAEKAWLERVAPPLARGLRQALLSHPGSAPAGRGPGIIVLDPAGRVVSTNPEADGWIDEIDSVFPSPPPGAFPIPFELQAFASRARAGGPTAGTRPARMRTRNGVWLLVHASRLGGTDQLALVIEPAKASDVAPLIVEAYGLSARELEVTRAIARGMKTAEIAGSMFLSPHTVRDHVKSVFEKVGVSSRGELVAKVFAEHYVEPLRDALAAAA
jgi:DNA-binding CsgD family transcriptional regulator